jgi:hypothetical protein
MIAQVIKTIRTLITQHKFNHSTMKLNKRLILLYDAYVFKALDKDFLIREIESLYNIRMDDFRIIEAAERRMPWINDAKAEIKWNFWNRYRDYMREEKNFSDTVLNQLTD